MITTAKTSQSLYGKMDCPECGRRTGWVFHDGGIHCFHPACDFHSTKKTLRGEPLLPKRKKPKESRKALEGFQDLELADPRHKYFLSHRHRGDLALQIEDLGIRQDGNRLAVGMYNSNGNLCGIQYIGPNGKKRFLKGCSTRGLFFRIGQTGTDKVGIAEGVATGVSFSKASGFDTYVAFGCNNLAAVANHVFSTGKQVVVCGDFGEDSARVAETVAAAVEGELYVPTFEDKSRGTDANDFAQQHGLKKLKADIRKNTALIPPLPDPIDVMANMSPAEFHKNRDELAAHVGITVVLLEEQVRNRRQEVRFEEIIPWADPVDGTELADAISTELDRHVFVSKSASAAIVCWIFFTHLIDQFRVAPILNINSPIKRCGKTTLLDFLGRTVARPMAASNVTSAAMFRMLELHQPTFLVDEADTFLKVNEELRGILNSGHTKSAAYVMRCAGDDNIPRRFCTWGAKAIASIKELPDTITDRSIVIPMRRKLATCKCKRLVEPVPGDVFDQLRRKIAKWCEDNAGDITSKRVRRVKGLHDRAYDNWRPLLQVARTLGPEWYEKVRGDSLKLAAHDAAEDSSAKVQLLQDLQQLFNEEKTDRLTTIFILAELAKKDDRPWPEYKNSNPITDRQMAKLLKDFSIVPKPFNNRKGKTNSKRKKTARGYLLKDFRDTFRRYCPPVDVTT